MRGFPAVWLLCLAALLSPAFSAAADAASADATPGPPFIVQVLGTGAPAPSTAAVTSGSLDSYFEMFNLRAAREPGTPFWLKLQTRAGFTAPAGTAPALIVRKGRHFALQVYPSTASSGTSTSFTVGETAAPMPLALAATRPTFRGAHDAVFVLPSSLAPGQVLYARVEAAGTGSEELHFSTGALNEVLAFGADHTRMITLAFGALMVMAITSLLIWFVLSDRLLIYYAVLFSMQALYIAFFSGQGFDWPWLSWALPLTSHAWNVPAAISGAAACMFVREIADLKRFWPRVHAAFGWLAVSFLVLAVANVGRRFGLGGIVANIGNLLFLGSAVFTLVVALMAWRRGGRAAGFFLIAWGLLEAFTIAAAIRLLTSDASDSDFLLHTGLPLSMVLAAVLIALGVADRLREQRRALSDAERRAETDPLTGVLNRRSLIERLEAACLRAQARDMPIALLFIDLDHFKQINDSYGHLAGDACLAAVVAPIQSELRQSDVVGRYGGEEFIVILSSASAAAAHPIAERIRERVAGVRVEGYGPTIRLTCSIGVAASDTLGVWGKHLIARADEAVYAAKRSGRNCVQMAEVLAA
ncbi:MAG: diguanylate cyclase [Gammaproteobacteria bacterium]